MSFFRFFLVYVFILLAFGLGFYVSLYKLIIPIPTSDETLANDEDYNPFKSGLQAFVKTAAMFSGELVSVG